MSQPQPNQVQNKRVPMYSAEEVAGLLGVSQRTVLRWVREGRVPALSVGRTRRFTHPSTWSEGFGKVAS